MGKGSKAPTPPDPAKTAAAQTGTNLATAQANAYLGNVNQVTPDGALTYSKSGQNWIDDPNGQTFYRAPDGSIVQNAPMISQAGAGGTQRIKTGTGANDYRTVTTGGKATSVMDPAYQAMKGYYVPSFTATQTLSPAQQAIKDQTDAANLNLGKTANERSAFLKDYLAKPFDGSNEATEARLMELGRKRLDPMVAQQDESLRNRLANQGIKAGSDAYGQEQNTFRQGTNDAYNQLILNGHDQAVQEALTLRNQPLNEVIALLNGTQVSQPNFVNANMPTIPTTDTAGIYQQDYQNKLGAWQTQQQQKQGVLGGLFGLGAAAIKASDKRLKENIRPIGKLMGQKIYEYNYKGSKDYQVGVMAQDVERKRPDAVITRPDGYKAVNYGKLFQLGSEGVAA
jgi:hypothetical protein